MSLTSSLENLTNNSALVTPAIMSSIDVALLRAAQIRGDFPTSLNLLNKIKTEIFGGDFNVDRLATMISADPLLALRAVSIANHSHYNTGEPVFIPSQAVKQIGPDKIENVLENISEPKNFNAIYLGRAVAVTMMQQALLAALISKKLMIHSQMKDLAERAYISSILTNIGPLLLAFHKPNVYSGLCLDCMDDRAKFEEAFRQIFRKSIGEFACIIARTLALPAEYFNVLLSIDTPPWAGSPVEDPDSMIASAIYAANLLAHEICYFTGIQGVQGLIRMLDRDSPFDQTILDDIVGTVADAYIDQTKMLELKAVRIPEYVLWFTPTNAADGSHKWQEALPQINERINPFLYELRACFKIKTKLNEFHRFPQALHCTLSALIKGLNFDRAVFLTWDKRKQFLKISLCLGVKLFKPEKIRRFFGYPDSENMPDIQACEKQEAVFQGEPLFSDGWPFVSFPAIWQNEVVGVFYADKVRRPDNDILSTQEQIACVALAEDWRDIPAEFY